MSAGEVNQELEQFLDCIESSWQDAVGNALADAYGTLCRPGERVHDVDRDGSRVRLRFRGPRRAVRLALLCRPGAARDLAALLTEAAQAIEPVPPPACGGCAGRGGRIAALERENAELAVLLARARLDGALALVRRGAAGGTHQREVLGELKAEAARAEQERRRAVRDEVGRPPFIPDGALRAAS